MPESTTYELTEGRWLLVCQGCGMAHIEPEPTDLPAVDPPGDFGFDRRAYVRGEVGK